MPPTMATTMATMMTMMVMMIGWSDPHFPHSLVSPSVRAPDQTPAEAKWVHDDNDDDDDDDDDDDGTVDNDDDADDPSRWQVSVWR